MFEFLFKYPPGVFSKGTFVLLGSWPRWVFGLTIVAAAALLAWVTWRKWARSGSRLPASMWRGRAVIVWALQSAMIALLLLLLWEPALSVASLKLQQNVIAVLIDDSRSMGINDGGESREQQAIGLLRSGLLTDLQTRFQVRLYSLDAGVERIQSAEQLRAAGNATQIGKGLRQIADEAGTLPIGAVILLSDGADNSSGVDAATLAELRRRRLPVNTIGFGREKMRRDVELDGLDLPNQALASSRLEAQVTIRQSGFGGKRAHLILASDGRMLASRDIVLQDSGQQIERVEFDAGAAGVKNIHARISALPGEENTANNELTRVLRVDETKRRILYVEGEPRWEYKFLRRALEADPAIQIVSILRTTENRIYRQGISRPDELVDGFPNKPEALFEYHGLILGSVESAFFTATQQELIKQFIDGRGGGVLFLAGRWALSDGGYDVAPFAELLPVVLPKRKNTFHQQLAAAEIADAGKQSLICRIEDDPEKNLNHWSELPYLANYQDPGAQKPGAVVLLRTNLNGNRIPLLISENYGRGRTAVLASAGTWRWRMQQPVSDTSQERFWRQLLRWLVSATPSRVVASTGTPGLEDDGRIEFRADVRDMSYLPTGDAEVEAHIIRPDGSADTLPMRPEPLSQGTYSLSWFAATPGSYVAEITAKIGAREVGRDVVTFRRENGVAENFHQEQNRELLEKLASETGGSYYKPGEARKLSREISYSEAGITSRETKDLWDMPAVFFAVIALRSAEWLLRRKWGAI